MLNKISRQHSKDLFFAYNVINLLLLLSLYYSHSSWVLKINFRVKKENNISILIVTQYKTYKPRKLELYWVVFYERKKRQEV